MKRIVIIILMISCSFLGNAQDIPVMDDILSIQPKWSYLSVDTNFYNLSPPENLYTPYWGLVPSHILIKDENIYLLEFKLGHGFITGGFEGYLLHNIDLETGVPIWVHHNNYFTGNTHQVTSYNGNLVELSNGNLVVNGNRNIDAIDTSTFNYSEAWYGTPFKDEIDFENGNLINRKFDSDTSHVLDNLFPNFHTKSIGGGKQFKIKITSDVDDGFLKNYLNLYIVDENSIVNKFPNYIYEHNTNIPNGLEIFSYKNYYNQINDDTGVAIFGSIDPTLINTPTEIKLLYFDTSDPQNVNIKKEINVLDIIPENQNELINPVSFIVENNNVILSQKVLIGEGTTTEEAYIWLTWFDEFGNRQGTADRFSYNGFDYQYISSVEFHDDALYVLLFSNEIAELNTYHFYKIKPNAEPQLIAEFEQIKPELEYIIGLGNLEFTEDLDVIMSFNIRYRIEHEFFPNLRSSVNYLCKFDGADFGLEPNATEEKEIQSNVTFFPNPVSNILFLNTHGLYVDMISIYDLGGREIFSQKDVNQGVDVTFLKAGMYKSIVTIDGKAYGGSFIKI